MNEILKKYSIFIKKIVKYKDYSIIEDEGNHLYIILQNNQISRNLISYLEEIEYPYMISIINSYEDSYLIYPYYEDYSIDLFSKGMEMVNALSLLHSKTLNTLDYTLEEIKKYYEKKISELDQLMNYYLELEKSIISNLLSPSSYLLLLHLSMIHRNIQYSKIELEKWYSYQDKEIRTSIIIGNTSFLNFIVGDKKYFIDYRECRRDIFLFDIISFLKNGILDVDIISLFETYQSKMNFTLSEYSFFFSQLLLPKKIELSNDVYSDVIKIRRELECMQKSFEFYLEENKKYQEANQEKFEEKDEDI